MSRRRPTPRSSWSVWIAVLTLLGVALLARAARADAPDLRTQTDADLVGLGDVVHVTLQATSYGGQPIDPQLGANGNFAVVQMTPSTSTQMTIANGSMSSQRVLTVVWALKATKVGNAVVGPFTVTVDGTRYKAGALRVKVVPAGQAPPRAAPRGNNSPFGFDPFGSFFNSPFGNNPFGNFPQLAPQAAAPQEVPVDPKLALDAPRGTNIFLHAVLDKTSAVLGEQVTYTCYIYIDLVGRTPDVSELHEAPTDNFARHSMQADDTHPSDAGFANVGGRIYKVEILRKVALFPLATGELATGPMSVQLGSSATELRKSEDLHVTVTQPPIDGRPAGYVVGDVGHLSISAEVVGADVEREGAVGVNVTVSGTGNLPASITPPERSGVEWLDPQTSEKLGPQAGDPKTNEKPGPEPSVRWGGSRTFRYVVRLHRAGDVDLGELALPYWDPDAKQYAVAKAALGTVHVRPGTATPTTGADAPIDPLPGLPAPQTALGTPRSGTVRPHMDDSPYFWLSLGAMPLAYFGVAGASTAARRAREKRAARAASPREELRARVAAANATSRDVQSDARAIDATTIRALEAATVAARGVNVRALATSDVAKALAGAGTPDEDARAIEAILRACEASRYSAGEGEGGDARARWARAKDVIERIARAP